MMKTIARKFEEEHSKTWKSYFKNKISQIKLQIQNFFSEMKFLILRKSYFKEKFLNKETGLILSKSTK